MGHRLKVKSLVFTFFYFFMIGALLVGINTSQVSAAVLTYHDVSQRLSGVGGVPPRIESAHSISGDGRYVVFSTRADNIVAGDTNSADDVFVRDTVSGTVTRVSVSSSGIEGDSHSYHASISHNGRFVVFSSWASNLAPGIADTSRTHIYMHDMVTATTVLVDTSAVGVLDSGYADYAKVNADGRFVVFIANATNLVPGINSPTKYQIYVKDTHSGAIKALSVTSSGAQGYSDSYWPDISCDGNTVAFLSNSSNLGVPTGQSGRLDVIIVSLGWSGDELTDITSGLESGIGGPAQISCDGNVALFVTSSTNVVSPSTPSGHINAYEYNRTTGVYTQVSLGNSNVQSNASSPNQDVTASMSGDGRYVAFVSGATNLDTTYPNGLDSGFNSNVYIRDVKKSTTEMVTVLPSGNTSRWVNNGSQVSISTDGSIVVFPYNVPSVTNSVRSLISGYDSGSAASYGNIFSAEMDY